VRAIKKNAAGRFCVPSDFFVSGAIPVGTRAEVCAPALDCQFSNCRANDQRLPDWSGNGTVDASDPRLDVDSTTGPGPETITVPGGLVDGEYLLGALFYSGTRGDRATMQVTVGNASRTATANVIEQSWTEMFVVRVVDGVGTIQAIPPTPFSCATNVDCPLRQTCEASQCVAGCDAASDCAATESCLASGVCGVPPPPTNLSGDELRFELTWLGAIDLDVRGVKADATGRFCVDRAFVPDAILPGQLVQVCAPAADCSFGNCRGVTALPDWDGSGGASVGDPRIDIDDTNGLGPENLTIPGGLVDGDYLFGAVVFASSRGDRPTLRAFEAGALQTTQTADALPSSWTELLVVHVVNGVVTYEELAPPPFSCGANNDCPQQHSCTVATGQCVAGCSTDAGCAADQTCSIDGICESGLFGEGCADTSDCAAGLLCVGTNFGGTCKEPCTTPADCEQCTAARGVACTCSDAGRCE
jgi:hypothetical protein